MPHIPKTAVRQLFEENQDKTWPGFRKALLLHRQGTLGGIEEPIIDELLALTTRMERGNETFPISADMLQRVVDRETHPSPA